MALTVDFSGDYDDVWDKTEAITYRSKNRFIYSNTSVTKALRAQPTERERAPTGGVYTGFDLIWVISDTLLTSTPKPGDLVKDSSELEWTVLTAEYDQLDQVWNLTTVDLSLANDLKDKIDIYQPDSTVDTAGAYNPTFTTKYASLNCRIQEISGSESEQRGLRGTLKRYEIYLAKQVEVSTRFYAQDSEGNKYDIVSWSNPDRIDELQVLSCELRP